MDLRPSDSESVSVTLPPDENGYLGRECPEAACNGYFKVKSGTGLTDGSTSFCPYCGHTTAPSGFATQEQIEYAKSAVIHQITGQLLKSLKHMEGRHPRSGGLFCIDFKVSGSLHPVKYYREKILETEIVCDRCPLGYAFYGVFAFCPDCGVHNPRQILEKNLELAEKELDLAASVESDLSAYLVNDALENLVSAFDGFGREICRVHAGQISDPAAVKNLSFQNLLHARSRVQSLFNVDLGGPLTAAEWNDACRSFQKRHLVSHKMGVVDQKYLDATNDPSATLGRKIVISSDEVRSTAATLRKLADHLVLGLQH